MPDNKFFLSRGFRRRMKKDLKLTFTPSRERAASLIEKGAIQKPRVEAEEPVKKRIPRASFKKPLELPD